jgi:hypothetical protein
MCVSFKIVVSAHYGSGRVGNIDYFCLGTAPGLDVRRLGSVSFVKCGAWVLQIGTRSSATPCRYPVFSDEGEAQQRVRLQSKPYQSPQARLM